MCSEVHSSSYLMFCSADRFWHYSQCCDKFVCLENWVYVRVDMHMRAFRCTSLCVCGYVRLLIPLRNQTASTFVVLTAIEDLAPIMQ